MSERPTHGGIERSEAESQSYTAWFTAYPSTHEKAGQTVEVIARWVYDALAQQHAGAIEALCEWLAADDAAEADFTDETEARLEAAIAVVRAIAGGQ